MVSVVPVQSTHLLSAPGDCHTLEVRREGARCHYNKKYSRNQTLTSFLEKNQSVTRCIDEQWTDDNSQH